MTHKKTVSFIYLSSLIILGINEGIFWLVKHFGQVEKSKDHYVMLISTSLLLVGFLLHSTEMSIKARGEEKLKALRQTKEWAVMDASIVVGELLFLISGIWSSLTMFYKLDDDITYSLQISLFLSGVVYMFIVVIASRKAMKYI